jgi:hypothetical protein
VRGCENGLSLTCHPLLSAARFRCRIILLLRPSWRTATPSARLSRSTRQRSPRRST